MEAKSELKYFSPNPVRGTNFDLSIERVGRILRENFGSKYNFTVMDETIYIENLVTKSKNCALIYKNQMNYGTAPWTLAKELTFKEYYSCGNSEQSIYNPSESDIIQFFQKTCK